GYPAGDARYHGAANADNARAGTWLCHCCATRAGLKGRNTPQYGDTVSRAHASGTAWARAREMGCDREQPEGALLRDHRRRTPRTCLREGGMGAHGVHHALAPERAAMTPREWVNRLWATF